MYSVGVFTTERSLRHIMLIDQKMQEHSNITYLPTHPLNTSNISMSRTATVLMDSCLQVLTHIMFCAKNLAR